MHNLTLGCLLDLSENPKTTAHVNNWRGKQDVSAAHLLCEMWRGEEKDMGVAREQTGQLTGEWVGVWKLIWVAKFMVVTKKNL